MASDYFLRLDGIKGESQDEKHKDEIEIDSFSWGLSNTSSFGSLAGGAGASKPSFQDFSFTADISKASPLLFSHSADSKLIDEGLITVRNAGAEQLEYYTVKLSPVMISGYNQAASTDGDRPMDEFTLRYNKIEVEYKTQKADGTTESVKAGWDLGANKKV